MLEPKLPETGCGGTGNKPFEKSVVPWGRGSRNETVTNGKENTQNYGHDGYVFRCNEIPQTTFLCHMDKEKDDKSGDCYPVSVKTTLQKLVDDGG